MSLFLTLAELTAVFEKYDRDREIMEQRFSISRLYQELEQRGLAALFDPNNDDSCLHHPSTAVLIQYVKAVPTAYHMFKKAYQGPPELLFEAWQNEDHDDWERFQRRVLNEHDFQLDNGWIVLRWVDVIAVNSIDEGVEEEN